MTRDPNDIFQKTFLNLRGVGISGIVVYEAYIGLPIYGNCHILVGRARLRCKLSMPQGLLQSLIFFWGV